MKIYNRLQLIRTERKMSRNELADVVGINSQTIGFIERGDYSPSLELAFKIAAVFNVSIETIFSTQQFESLFNNENKELTK
ncbi:transcriptional regulator [Candidatus Saccharibacteria bacterium HGW-Saccharibacteria-1]|jgi:DNA-binding XRE family transcriptional regulator|nr:MAG: transcriptional regulator [Candidatus Saccharibacteria bacterium HGW-Saccharibacteria-1]